MDPMIERKVNKICTLLRDLETETVAPLSGVTYTPSGYKKPGVFPVPDGTWEAWDPYMRVHGRDAHYWFHAAFDTPEDVPEKDLSLRLSTGKEGEWDATNPQGMLYENGVLLGAYDVNHRLIRLQGGRHYDVLLYFYCGMEDVPVEVCLDLTRTDRRIRALYYDLQVPLEAARCFDPADYTYIRILRALEIACNFLDLREPGSDEFFESVREAENWLKTEFYEKECGNREAVTSYVGHTHIDVAWLWTLSQTREKVQRTFVNMLDLMDRYPEFIFMSSQPQLFKFLKEEDPALYARVREKVLEGRFEAEGAMWLEADCNLSSGESLVRQILHGKRFLKEEFGVDSKVLWLPDVFGYSAALPQILKKSGVTSFVTSKISWNETDKLPYDTFLWRGLDGTEIFTYFLTARKYDPKAETDNTTTYVADATPAFNRGTWERYQQKEYNQETILTFGYGDGGGGTTAEMLEYFRRLTYGLPGQPKAQMSTAGAFLERVRENFMKNCALLRRTPRWVGELYLEKHRGTYTSTAKNKRNNRMAEQRLEEAESLSVLGKALFGSPYEAELFRRNWETVLLNQFHDIIPGSSIFEVYEESDRQYGTLMGEVGGALEKALKPLSEAFRGPIAVNMNGFTASSYVKTPEGRYVFAGDVPAYGFRTLPGPALEGEGDAPEESAEAAILEADVPLEASKEFLRSPFHETRFDRQMRITSLKDLRNAGRELVPAGEPMNVLRSYENYPYDYDNWEVSNYHEVKYHDVTDVVSAEPFCEGETAGVRTVYRYGKSEIRQTVRVYLRSPRIDFETEADWQEGHQILKALFPVDVKATEATYEIQYGHVKRPTHRNTSWDAARFEVCAHRWMDFSENGCGLSVLNDCKYGCSVFDHTMTLSLIKTGTYPNPVSDIGKHVFTYALLTHQGDLEEAGTVREAALLNRPVRVIPGTGERTADFSLVRAEEKNVIVETLKQAEDGDGSIVRLYESADRKTEAHLRFGIPVKEAVLTDLMENDLKPLPCEDGKVTVPLGNFEIATIRVHI